jgi:hypothetical protein
VPTPVATQSSIRREEHRDVLRETQPIFDFGFWIEDWRTAEGGERVASSQLRAASYERRLAGVRTLSWWGTSISVLATLRVLDSQANSGKT